MRSSWGELAVIVPRYNEAPVVDELFTQLVGVLDPFIVSGTRI